MDNRWGEWLRTNRLAIAAEIIIVLVPAVITLLVFGFFTPRSLIVGIAAEALMITSLLVAWGALRMRQSGWSEYGLSRPKSWLQTFLLATGGTIVILLIVVNLLEPLVSRFSAPDYSRYEMIRGNIPMLLLSVVVAWTLAAFGEELLHRGFLLNRLADLFGGWKTGCTISLFVSSAVFGLFHADRGPAGVVISGTVGLLFGGLYFIAKRNLWPVILAHGIMDSLGAFVAFASPSPLG